MKISEIVKLVVLFYDDIGNIFKIIWAIIEFLARTSKTCEWNQKHGYKQKILKKFFFKICTTGITHDV